MYDEDAIAESAQGDLSEVLQLYPVLEGHGLGIQHHKGGACHHQHGRYTLRGGGGGGRVIVNPVQQIVILG